jgi:hypothetical protein
LNPFLRRRHVSHSLISTATTLVSDDDDDDDDREVEEVEVEVNVEVESIECWLSWWLR